MALVSAARAADLEVSRVDVHARLACCVRRSTPRGPLKPRADAWVGHPTIAHPPARRCTATARRAQRRRRHTPTGDRIWDCRRRSRANTTLLRVQGGTPWTR